MKAYNWTWEEAERETGFVRSKPVAVSKGSGVEVEVRVGVDVDSACRARCAFRVWSAIALA